MRIEFFGNGKKRTRVLAWPRSWLVALALLAVGLDKAALGEADPATIQGEPGQFSSLEPENKVKKLLMQVKFLHWQEGAELTGPLFKQKSIVPPTSDDPGLWADSVSAPHGFYRHSNLWLSPTLAPSSLEFVFFVQKQLPGFLWKRQPSTPGEKPVEPPEIAEDSSNRALWANVVGSDQGLASDKRAARVQVLVQTIAGIDENLKGTREVPLKVELLYNKGLKLTELGSWVLQEELQAHYENWSRWKNTLTGPEPKMGGLKALGFWSKAESAFEEIGKLNSQHPLVPESQLRRSVLLLLKDPELARLAAKRVRETYPQSPWTRWTQLVEGQGLMAQKQYMRANESLALFLANSPSGAEGKLAATYALYLSGWNRFLQNPTGTTTIPQVLADWDRVVGKLDSSAKESREIRRLVQGDRVFLVAQEKTQEQIQKYDPLLPQALLRSAHLSVQKGEWELARPLYFTVLKRWPKEAFVLQIVNAILEGSQRSRDKASQLAAARWLDASGEKVNPQEKVANAVLASLRFLGSQAQNSGIGDQKKEDLQQASVFLGSYLKLSPSLPDSVDVWHNRGHVLAGIDDPLGASQHYLNGTLLDLKLRGSAARQQDSAVKTGLMNTLLAADLHVSKSASENKLNTSLLTAPVAPLPGQKNQLVALNLLIETQPRDGLVPVWLHRAALLEFHLGEYEKSLAKWSTLAQSHGSLASTGKGAALSVWVKAERREWDGVSQLARKFLSYGGFAQAPAGRWMESVWKGAEFEYGLSLEKKQNLSAAADVFLNYQKNFSTDPDSPRALYNASNYFYRLGESEKALVSLDKLTKLYGSHFLVPHSYYLMGVTYEHLGEFSQAATHFSSIVKKNFKNPMAESSLLRAIKSRFAVGEWEPLKADLGTMQKTFPNSLLLPEARHLLAKTFEAQGQKEAGLKAHWANMTDFASTYPHFALRSLGHAAWALPKQKQKESLALLTTQSQKLLSQLGNQRTPESTEGLALYADFLFQESYSAYQVLVKSSITDPKRLTDQFNALRQRGDDIIADLKKVSALGELNSKVASQYLEGAIKEHLAGMLLKAPVDPNESASAREALKATLEKVAFPLQDEALVAYQEAWSRARSQASFESTSPVLEALLSRLAFLKPQEYQVMPEEFPRPLYLESQLLEMVETKDILAKR